MALQSSRWRGSEPGDHLGVVVVEEQGAAGVEGGDPGHLLVGELEVEDADVLGHALGPHGLGDGDDTALGQPAQYDLGDGPAVFLADLGEERVGEQVVLAFGEAAPGLDLHPVLTREVLIVGALEERVRLDLNGCVSTWLTAGVTSLLTIRSISRSG